MISFANARTPRSAKRPRAILRCMAVMRRRADRPIAARPGSGPGAGSVRFLRVSPRFVSGAGHRPRAHCQSGPPARVVPSWRERLSQVCRDHPRRLQRSCNAASVRRIRVGRGSCATAPTGTICMAQVGNDKWFFRARHARQPNPWTAKLISSISPLQAAARSSRTAGPRPVRRGGRPGSVFDLCGGSDRCAASDGGKPNRAAD